MTFVIVLVFGLVYFSGWVLIHDLNIFFMMKIPLAFIIFTHGLIHFMGFAKAYGYGKITQLTKEVSKTVGAFWFLTAFLCITATILYLLRKESWPVVGILAAILSQILIITAWTDAKFGTIANIIILLVAIPAYGNFRFEKMTTKEVNELLPMTIRDKSIITKEMINNLPPIVQKWLARCGII